MQKWCVGDECDNFDQFETAEEAAKLASSLVEQGHKGVHILYLTKAEFDAMCETGVHIVGEK